MAFYSRIKSMFKPKDKFRFDIRPSDFPSFFLSDSPSATPSATPTTTPSTTLSATPLATPLATPSATSLATLSATPSATLLATPSSTPSAMTEEQNFLELTKACQDQVQGMLMRNVDGSMTRLRVNNKQCIYLGEKLKNAIQEAEIFLTHLQESPISHREISNSLNDFKLLYNVAYGVKNFIKNCCKDAWVAAALLMSNMTQDVLSLGIDLALLAALFTQNRKIEVDIIYSGEVSIVLEKSTSDRHTLLSNVKALLTKEGPSTKYQLPESLVMKFESSGANRTDNESLKEGRLIGRGAFADVYKSKWLGVDVAVKTFHGPSSPVFQAEVSIVGGLSHPNITSLFCYAEDDKECSIVMELMDCDLSRMIRYIMKDRTKELHYPFNIFEAVDIMLQIGRGIEYLHGMKIVHRDLKAANILVKQLGNGEDGESKSMLVKVADFGLSKTKEKSMTYSRQTANTGTTRWMAPEVIRMRPNDGQEEVSSNDSNVMKYPYRIDVYSYGMVCYEILTGNVPFFEVPTPSEVKAKILNGDRPKLPEHCFAELKELITRCWSQDPSERPCFDEICTKLRSLRFQLLMRDTQQRVGPQIVVGLDFGTTTSGYAFAHKSEPEEVMTFYDWPQPMMNSYCKTLSAMYYEPGDATTAKVKSWGSSALQDYTHDTARTKRRRRSRRKSRTMSAAELPEIGTYLVRFKLHLASKDAGKSSAAKLPKGFTVTQVISDYLREIGASIMSHLRTKYSEDITMADVQWCVTVPSIWDDQAKKQMQVCMARSGLVRGPNSPEGSPHPLSIVLESEAASCYCHRNMPDLELKVGDRLLVADIGGGTTEIVVQEWLSETPKDYRVKEVTNSTGGLCGGTYVDEQFKTFLFETIQCQPQFLWRSTAIVGEIFKQWEEIKCRFGDIISESFVIHLPSKLSVEWKRFDEDHGKPPRDFYDVLELTHADMKAIFDPVVDANLALIGNQISQTENIKVIFVVGGFAGSPYLLTKIKERFLGIVEKVISPVQPGSAVCQGAVMLALNPARITT